MRHALGRVTRRLLLPLVAALLASGGTAAAAFADGAPSTSGAARPSVPADSGIGSVAAALERGPVHVDPGAAGQLSPSEAAALSSTITKAGKPVFVAVLPATAAFPPQTVLRDLRSAVGIAGVYAIRLGDRFDAGADPRVMSHDAVTNLVGEVKRSSGSAGSSVTAASADTELTAFVDQAVRQAHGSAPASWAGHSSGGGPGSSFDPSGPGVGLTALVVLGLVLLGAGCGAVVLHRRRRARLRHDDRVQLDHLRTVVDEDITAFGEELDRLDFSPGDPAADDAMLGDWAHALDAYETAKERMAAARHPDDVRPVTEALEDGRFSLATLAARRAGEPLPERRPPCFFDPRHGPSVRDVVWAPPGGVRREVPACAADATRVDDGREPMSRTVRTDSGPEPYWNAGHTYAPWAGGYFGGGVLPGLLIGTMLGGALGGPGWGYGYGYDGGEGGYGGGDGGDGGPAGGDYTGSDFDPGDFGGGGFGDGGGGGGFGDGGGFS